MLRTFALALTLLAILVLPTTALAREPTQGVRASAKSVSASPKHAVKKRATKQSRSTKAHKRKAAGMALQRTGAKAQHVAAQPLALEDLLGEPYDGGELTLRSASVLVVDQATGEALYAKNADRPAPIASITKLMTAMVTLDAGLPLDEEITIGPEDVDRLKGTRSRLALGTTLTREALLHLALIASENRAAAALSRAYPGGRPAFIEAMNRKARQLGMTHTRFVDGTGLSSENQSTAQDLVKLVDAAYHYPLIRRISTTGRYDLLVSTPNEVRHLVFNNTNQLTRRDDWEIGVSKTGYINEAGHCLVMQAKIAEQKVIIVLLDSWGKLSRIGDANRIRKWLEYEGTGRLASRTGKAPV